MNNHSLPRPLTILKASSMAAGLVVVLVSSLVLLGWVFALPTLQYILPGLPKMVANTAATFVLAGLSLWLPQKTSAQATHQHRQRRLAQALALAVTLLGLLTLSQYLFGWNLSIDQLFFWDPAGTLETSIPGRPSPHTALAFVLIGCALLLLNGDSYGGHWLSQYLALTAGFIALLALIGYAFNVPIFFKVSPYTGMALHTAVTFLVLCAGLLLAQPDRGLVAVFTGNNLGGALARRLLLAALGIPLLVGWVSVGGERLGLYRSEFEPVLLAALSIYAFGGVIWWYASSLGRLDLARRQMEKALRESEATFRHLFAHHPHPMWVYDSKTLQFLEVNDAAVDHYGFSRDEFLHLRISDIRPPEDIPRLLESLKQERPILQHSGDWRHRLKDGRVIDVEITSHTLDFAGRSAVLVVAQDITERRRAEQQLHLQAAALASAANAIVITDRQGTILWANPAFTSLTGYTLEEAAGETPRILKSGRQDTVFYRNLWETILAGQVWHGEIINRRQDGSLYSEEMTITPVRDEHDDISHFIAIKQDVTERKQAEELLSQAEQRYRTLFEDAPVMYVITRNQQRAPVIVDCNQLFLETLGYSRTEVLEQPLADFYTPDSRNKLLSGGYQQALAGHFVAQERELVTRSGRVVKTLLQAIPEFDVENRAVGTRAMYVDITERIQMEEERAQLLAREQVARSEAEAARERFSFLAEASRLLGSSLDYQATLTSMADLAVATIADWCAVDVLEEGDGVRRVAVMHKDPAKIEWVQQLQRHYAARAQPNPEMGVARVLRTGRPEFYPEISEAVLDAATSDRELRAILRQLGLASAIIVPLLARGRTLGAISFVAAESGRRYGEADLALAEELASRAALAIDNARLYREAQVLNAELERRVQERTARLETANKELEAFSYSVSHDLRAPLRAIDGFSRILLEDYAPQLAPEIQRFLDLVRDNTRQMGQLIDDLLTFSRLGRQPVQKHLVAPADLVRQALEGLRAERAGRQVEISIGDLPSCEADPALLRQVWLNLLANALKYTRQREAAVIEVGGREVDGEIVYFVKDNGVGFEMQYADKIFGVFQRLHRAEEYEGTGVGLATVQRIIHRHGGRVWAEAELNKGATFYFTI